MTLKTFLLACLCLSVCSGYSQTKTDSISKKSSDVVSNKDSVIDGKLFASEKKIDVEVDTLGVKNLKDLPQVAELDKKWLDELYNNSLFDFRV